MIFLAELLAISSGFGIAFLVIAMRVNKSNNLGDSHCKFEDLAKGPIDFVCKENAHHRDLDEFIKGYGDPNRW